MKDNSSFDLRGQIGLNGDVLDTQTVSRVANRVIILTQYTLCRFIPTGGRTVLANGNSALLRACQRPTNGSWDGPKGFPCQPGQLIIDRASTNSPAKCHRG